MAGHRNHANHAPDKEYRHKARPIAPSPAAESMLSLQRSIGNRATVSLYTHALLPIQRTPETALALAKQRGYEVDTWEELDQLNDDGGVDEGDWADIQAEYDVRAPSIGERKKAKRDFDKISSPRLKEKYAAEHGIVGEGEATRSSSAPKKKATRKAGIWNEVSRPDYDEATWKTCLARLTAGTTADTWLCGQPDCRTPTAELPRWDFSMGARNGITLDHHTAWRQYIWSKAEPDEEGYITNAAAKVAYNDTDNLIAMCRDCNSRKNGEKDLLHLV